MPNKKHTQVVDFSIPNVDKVISASTQAPVPNNKQSSVVDWIEHQVNQRGITHFFSLKEILQQAKEMHHKEVVDFVEDWYCNGPLLGGGVNLVETIEKHYNKTFGGNNAQ
jgi:hypothetical protein